MPSVKIPATNKARARFVRAVHRIAEAPSSIEAIRLRCALGARTASAPGGSMAEARNDAAMALRMLDVAEDALAGIRNELAEILHLPDDEGEG